MKARSHVNIFDESKKPWQIIFLLAWPVFVEQFLSSLVSYIDTAMVGSLGAYATVAVSISNTPMFLITSLCMASGTGLTAIAARAMGQRDYEKVKSVSRHAILSLVFLGIPFSVLFGALYKLIPLWMGAEPDVLPYASTYNLIVACGRPFHMATFVLHSVYRGTGDTRTPMRVNLSMNLINVIGNFFLIKDCHVFNLFGAEIIIPAAGWGVAGAAAATAFAYFCGGSAILLTTFLKKSYVQISIHDSFKPDWDLVRPITKISLPALWERLCTRGAMMVSTATIASLGTISVAANSLYQTAESFTHMPMMAFSTAATTMVGQYLGAKMPDKANKSVLRLCVYGMVISLMVSALIFTFSAQIISFFTPDEAVIELGSRCVRIVSFAQPIMLLANVLPGALRGAGDTRPTFVYTAISVWSVRIVGTIICIRVLHLPLPYAVYCMIGDMFVRAVLFAIRFASGKWKNALKD